MIIRALMVTFFLAILSVSQSAVAKRLDGTVTVGGQPVAGANVTLWQTAGKEAPKSVAEASTGAKGDFALHDFPLFTDGGVYYLTTRSGSSDALALMSVLGTEPPDKVVVNELTTVASVFTSARFIDGTAISGNALGLAYRRGQCTEPGGSRDRRLGQGAARSDQQHREHDAGAAEHARSTDHRVRHRGRRRLARRLPQGRDPDRRR